MENKPTIVLVKHRVDPALAARVILNSRKIAIFVTSGEFFDGKSIFIACSYGAPAIFPAIGNGYSAISPVLLKGIENAEGRFVCKTRQMNR